MFKTTEFQNSVGLTTWLVRESRGTSRESRRACGSKLAPLAATASLGLKRATKESRHAAEQRAAEAKVPHIGRKTHQPAVLDSVKQDGRSPTTILAGRRV
jgi:hypothetical protein